jgi:beta-lactamase superfamily II metal-dependent hydrolase
MRAGEYLLSSATEVLNRLEAIGATVLRTDRDGQITMETDGQEVVYRTYTSGQGRVGQR